MSSLSCGCDGPSEEEVMEDMNGICPLCGDILDSEDEDSEEDELELFWDIEEKWHGEIRSMAAERGLTIRQAMRERFGY